MSDFSNYAENAVFNHLFRNTALTSPTTVYVALYTAVTNAEAGTGTELAVSGYARQAITFGAPSDGVGSNTGALTFGPLLGAGTVTHAAIIDAPTGGNALSSIKALSSSVTFASGDSIQFAAGQLSFTIA